MKSLKWRGTEAQADDIKAWLHTDDFNWDNEIAYLIDGFSVNAVSAY